MSKAGCKLLIEENAPLAPYTTLEVGGPARFLVRAQTEDDVFEGLHLARKSGCPVFILGGGSNIVVSDSGFPGIAIRIELTGIQSKEETDSGRIEAAAGQEWDSFVRYCVDRNLAGIECLSGIPGTVGGTPVQNVGAYGQEVSETILQVRVLDRSNDSVTELTREQCCFSYRTSIFNCTARDRYIVLRVEFALHPGGEPCIRYQDLRQHFSEKPETPKIRDVREAVLRIRESKGMALPGKDPDSRSAGSFFKNPILDPAEALISEENARVRGIIGPGERIPRFAAEYGKEKLAAAWLIEHAGFCKGFKHGNAGISGKHSLSLINRGGASAQEIVELMHLIQARVRELFGIELKPEPVFVGFDKEVVSSQ